MKTKNRNLFRFICFVLTLMLLYSGVSCLFIPKDNEWKNFRGLYAESRGSLDVIYLGGSVCIDSWMPYEAWRESGLTSYALGKSKFPSFAYEPIISEAMLRQDPQLLIIDALPFVYTYTVLHDDVFSAVPLIYCLKTYSPNRLPISKICYSIYCHKVSDGKREASFETFASMFFDIVRYHVNWITLDSSFFPNADGSLPYNYSKGFNEVYQHEVLTLRDNSGVISSKAVNPRAESDLISLLDYLDNIGMDALFVVAPYDERSGEKAQYNYLSNIIASRGQRFVNFNDFCDEIGIDGDTDFYNSSHLSVFGAEKYTSHLSAYIKENYSIQIAHSDAVISSWERGYPLWNERLAALKGALTAFIVEEEKGGSSNE